MPYLAAIFARFMRMFHVKNQNNGFVILQSFLRRYILLKRGENRSTRGKKNLELIMQNKKVREKSRECHNHKPQAFPDPKRKRKPTNPNKHKSNKRTKSTKISSLFPKRGNRNTKRTEKHKNKMTHGKTYNKSPRRINHKATKSKTNTGTTALKRSAKPNKLNELFESQYFNSSSKTFLCSTCREPNRAQNPITHDLAYLHTSARMVTQNVTFILVDVRI